MMADIKKLIEILYVDGSITRDGSYTLPRKIAELALIEFDKTGINYLPEYDRLTFLSWDRGGEGYARPDDIELWESAVNRENFWNIYSMFDRSVIQEISEYVERSKRFYINQAAYEKRRQIAIIHTSKKDVRERIFTRDGWKCKRCKAHDNLTIDHIVSVLNGGGNEDDNLQTLCRPCNSRKGGR